MHGRGLAGLLHKHRRTGVTEERGRGRIVRIDKAAQRIPSADEHSGGASAAKHRRLM